jgi:endonuclease YncB( thermonuclease family)
LFSQTYKGTVLYVIDGDTFVLQCDEGSLKVRLEGIDAPEKDQPYGQESKAFLAKYQYASCIIIKSSIDRYGRTIAQLLIDSVNINLLMVRTGNAWHYKYYSSDPELAKAENFARNEKLGLWQDLNPIEPWQWRKK